MRVDGIRIVLGAGNGTETFPRYVSCGNIERYDRISKRGAGDESGVLMQVCMERRGL